MQRHGEDITTQQLDDRATKGVDPMTGTTDDGIKKNLDGTPKTHNYSKYATKFTSKEALVKGDDYMEKQSKV